MRYNYSIQLCATIMRYNYAIQLCATSIRYKYAIQLCATIMQYSYATQLFDTTIRYNYALQLFDTMYGEVQKVKRSRALPVSSGIRRQPSMRSLSMGSTQQLANIKQALLNRHKTNSNSRQPGRRAAGRIPANPDHQQPIHSALRHCVIASVVVEALPNIPNGAIPSMQCHPADRR